MRSRKTVLIESLEEIAEQFELFLVDQYGVLHNGHHAYAGAQDCLETLRRRGKRVVVLTNSGRSEQYNLRHLEHLGFTGDMIDGIVTSGETCIAALAEMKGGSGFPVTFPVCERGDLSLLRRHDVPLCGSPQDAEVIFLAGFPEARHAQALDFVFSQALLRDVPMVCANPDVVCPGLQGRRLLGIGALAQRYAERGGRVRYFGKPHAEIYRAALARFPGVSRERTLAIGDSLAHDIRGAISFGIAGLFVTGGIFAQDFLHCQRADDHLRVLSVVEQSVSADSAMASSCSPDWMIRSLLWQ